MGMAKRSMPDLTDDEAEAMEREFNDYCEWHERQGLVVLHMESCQADADAAADDAAAERKHPHADPHCGYCLGTGIVRDWVDYGSTVVSMDSTCDCVEDGDNG
jgi:hypothetical protein